MRAPHDNDVMKSAIANSAPIGKQKAGEISLQKSESMLCACSFPGFEPCADGEEERRRLVGTFEPQLQGKRFFIAIGRNPLKSPDSKK